MLRSWCSPNTFATVSSGSSGQALKIVVSVLDRSSSVGLSPSCTTSKGSTGFASPCAIAYSRHALLDARSFSTARVSRTVSNVPDSVGIDSTMSSFNNPDACTSAESTSTDGRAMRFSVPFIVSSNRSTVAEMPSTIGIAGIIPWPLIRRWTIVVRSLTGCIPRCASSNTMYNVRSSLLMVLASTS